MVSPGRSIKCQSCGASVPWVEGVASVECSYCHNHVLLRSPVPSAAPAFIDFVVARDGSLVVLHTDGQVTTYAVTLPVP